MLILLADAPYDMPSTLELDDGSVPDRLTISHYGRNIHFVLTGEVASVSDQPAPVFKWSYDTAIAE